MYETSDKSNIALLFFQSTASFAVAHTINFYRRPKRGFFKSGENRRDLQKSASLKETQQALRVKKAPARGCEEVKRQGLTKIYAEPRKKTTLCGNSRFNKREKTFHGNLCAQEQKNVPRKFAQISKKNVQRILTARRTKEKAAGDLKSKARLTRRRAFFA